MIPNFVTNSLMTVGTSTTVVDNILGQVTAVTTLMIDIMTTLLGNVYFDFLFACGFVAIGMRLIRKAKRTAK